MFKFEVMYICILWDNIFVEYAIFTNILAVLGELTIESI